MSLAATTRNPDLDGLRGIAIVLVLYCHLGWKANLIGSNESWIGVDIFFVLSGFLITSILLGTLGQNDYYRRFYRRRTLRIFPPFYAVLAVMLLVSLMGHKHGSWQIWVINALFLTSLFAKYMVSHSASLTLRVFEATYSLWSVSIEELFYLAWAPAVKLLTNPRYLVALLLVVLFVEPFARYTFHAPAFLEYWMFPFRLDGLATGALVAISIKFTRLGVKRLETATSILLWVVLAVDAPAFYFTSFDRSSLRFAAIGYSLLSLTAGAILIWCLARAGKNTIAQRVLRNPVLNYFGRRSYMIYLFHQFAIVSLQSYLAKRALHERLPLVIGGLLGVGVTIIVAEISWRYMESPLLASNYEQKIVENEIVRS